MRMEELSDSTYIKQTDTVEKYLLNLVQNYFKETNIASSTSREFIIKRAVERMKEEMEYDQLGVLSITLPNGEKRTGAVDITLDDLLAEPKITPKKSAFNVSFGTEQNTACEGNDPRLSDKREPLDHKHEINDIAGLEGLLSSISGKVQRVNDFLHEHNNKNVLDLIAYSGEKTQIDLIKLETIENTIQTMVSEIQDEINSYRTEIQEKITELENETNNINEEMNSIKEFISNQNEEYYDNIKDYCDNKVIDMNNQMEEELKNYIKSDNADSIFEICNNSYIPVGTMESDLTNISSSNKTKVITIDNEILNGIQDRNQTLQDSQIEIVYKHIEDDKVLYSNIPFIDIKDNITNGIIQSSIDYENNSIIIDFNYNTIPSNINNNSIIITISSKMNISL